MELPINTPIMVLSFNGCAISTGKIIIADDECPKIAHDDGGFDSWWPTEWLEVLPS